MVGVDWRHKERSVVARRGGGGGGEEPRWIFGVGASQSSGSCLMRRRGKKKRTCITVQLTAPLQRPLSQAHALQWPVNQVEVEVWFRTRPPESLNSCTSVLSSLQSKAFPVGLSIKEPIDALLVAAAR